MKIHCNVCEAAEAAVLCCADEAALCWACDEKVHAANKLASKHQRVPLSTSNSHMPKCDICQKILVIFYDVQQLHPNEIRHVWKIIFDVEFPQKVEGEIDNFGHMTELLNSEAVGYFFCLEDRALLCRNCDVAIHTVNSLVSSHQRFLLTGVRVGLEAADPGASSSPGKSCSSEKVLEAEISHSLPGRVVPSSTTTQFNKVTPAQSAGAGDLIPPKLPFSGGSSAESVQQWQFDDFLALTDFSQNYYLDNGSSKADSGKLGESDGSPILRAMDIELDGEECLGRVPDASWAVPQMSSPPTASGLNWPKDPRHHQQPKDSAAFVPDVCYLALPNLYGSQQNTNPMKRRRQF